MILLQTFHNAQDLYGEEGGQAESRGWEQIKLLPGEVLDGAGEGITLIPVPLTGSAGLQKVLSWSVGSVKRLFIKHHGASLEKMDPLPFICLEVLAGVGAWGFANGKKKGSKVVEVGKESCWCRQAHCARVSLLWPKSYKRSGSENEHKSQELPLSAFFSITDSFNHKPKTFAMCRALPFAQEWQDDPLLWALG